MPRPRRHFSRLLLFTLMSCATAAAFWLGLVPQRLSPFTPLDLAVSDPWFLDVRLAALRSDAALCSAVLKGPAATASSIDEQPYDKGCGWKAAVRMSQAGGASVAIDKLSCPMAAALAMWMEHEVQPAARDLLNARVTSVKHMGTYACRNIVGSKALKSFRSQHATANAIDIAAFVLDDGRTVSLAKHWKGDAAEARFLKTIHRQACRYFRVALGPDFNAAHANHFHLDRGPFKSCR